MSRARNLSKLGNPSVLSVSTDNNVGINSTSPVEKLNVVGVVSATSFAGDGSGLTGVASTDNIITGTAATFTGSVNISGITTVGILTAYTSVKVGSAVTINSSGANVTGVVTATNVSVGQSVTAASFFGDGSKLQGVTAAPTSFDITSSLFM